MSHTPLGQSDLVYQLSEHSGFCWRLRKPSAGPCYQPGRSLVAQYRSSGREREVDKLTEDGEVEAHGEMELDETEGVGEETGYLEDHEEGVIALWVFWRILTVMWSYTYTYTYPAAVFSAVYLSGGKCRFSRYSAWKVITTFCNNSDDWSTLCSPYQKQKAGIGHCSSRSHHGCNLFIFQQRFQLMKNSICFCVYSDLLRQKV